MPAINQTLSQADEYEQQTVDRKFFPIGFIFLMLLFTGCGGSMEKFDWKASDSAPENHLMQIIKGDFFYPEEGSLYIPTKAILKKGWGKPESSHLVGPDLKPLPNRLEIVFFSYLENEFYRGDFELPYDKILKLFQDGFYSLKAAKQTTFTQITAGVAPGGVVAVWLKGTGNTTEVFYGKAKKVKGDWKSVYHLDDYTREEFVRSELEDNLNSDVLSSFIKNGIDFNQWDKFRKRYDWTPVLNIPNPLSHIRQYINFNGEVGYMEYPLDESKNNKTRVVPKEIYYVWKNPQGLILGLKYTFNENEIFNAFEKLAPTVNGVSTTPLQLEINITQNEAGKNSYSVGVRNEKERVLLTKTDIEISRTSITEEELKEHY